MTTFRVHPKNLENKNSVKTFWLAFDIRRKSKRKRKITVAYGSSGTVAELSRNTAITFLK